MSVIKILTVKDQKSIIDILIARPEVTEVTMKNPSNSLETKNFGVTLLNFCDTASFLYFWIWKNTFTVQKPLLLCKYVNNK